jgi:hypothetical protein
MSSLSTIHIGLHSGLLHATRASPQHPTLRPYKPVTPSPSSLPPQSSVPQPLIKSDPLLKDHEAHLAYRWSQYKETKQAIVKAEGGLANFAQVRCGCVM